MPDAVPPSAPDAADPAALARLAAELEAHPDYRVLRRLPDGDVLGEPSGDADVRTALVVDVETTGFDAATDAIIELGVVRFSYDATSGQPLQLLDAVSLLEDPGRPIPAEVVALTGITDEMVRGRRIDEARVAELLADAVLVIAHNAGFDRPFVERRLPAFTDVHWACSQRDVDWRALGVGSAALEFIVYKHLGAFFDGHRAVDDCRATLRALATRATPADGDGVLPMRVLLDEARRPRVRLCASGSDKASKDVLRQRGYRWTGAEGTPRYTWCRELPRDESEAELAWLREAVYDAFGTRMPALSPEPVDLRRRWA